MAGCGRAIRENTAPGGLDIRNERGATVTVVVRAVARPASDEGFTPTPQETPSPIPADAAVYAGEFDVPAEDRRIVTDFFREPGRYLVDVTAGSARTLTTIELFETARGTGADTVVIRLETGGQLKVRATEVD